MNGALHNRKKRFSICRYILEAKRGNLLVLRIVRYSFRVKPVHPLFYWDECNLVDCKGIWELVFQLWQWSKTLVFYSLEPKSPGSILFGGLTCSTSWNRPLQSLNCHGERLFHAKWQQRKMPDFFGADLILVYSLMDYLWMVMLWNQEELSFIVSTIIIVSVIVLGNTPHGLILTRAHRVVQSLLQGLCISVMTLCRSWEGKSCVIMWPCFLLW